VKLKRNDAYCLSTAKRRLDNIYYTLVEEATRNKSYNNNNINIEEGKLHNESNITTTSPSTTTHRNFVPRIVLNALIEAAGKMGLTDRAFATFQEYRTLFHLVPDIHAYNSLLAGVSHCRYGWIDQFIDR